MSEKNSVYKLIIGILLVVIFLQWLVILKPKPKKTVKAPVPQKARIAIVIDDWGYNLNNLNIVDQIKYPLSAAVLPNLIYSQRIAEELRARGFEIILHLPMEPREKYRLETNTIMASFDAETIRGIIERDLFSLANAKGVSNHMGSMITENSRIMEIIFKELKKRGIFFLDSFVSPRSVCFDLASKVGLGFAKRDIFLDNIENPEYIRGQINKLKSAAKVKGYAIGIGHNQKVTLEVLRDVMPQLEREGYKFVYLSELIRRFSN